MCPREVYVRVLLEIGLCPLVVARPSFAVPTPACTGMGQRCLHEAHRCALLAAGSLQGNVPDAWLQTPKSPTCRPTARATLASPAGGGPGRRHPASKQCQADYRWAHPLREHLGPGLDPLAAVTAMTRPLGLSRLSHCRGEPMLCNRTRGLHLLHGNVSITTFGKGRRQAGS